VLEAGEYPEERRLADSVRADDADAVTGRDDERDAVEHLHGGEALRDLACNEAVGHGLSSFGRKGEERCFD
jgi:hypothetical protein